MMTPDCLTASHCRYILFRKDRRQAFGMRRKTAARQEFYDLPAERDAKLENTDERRAVA